MSSIGFIGFGEAAQAVAQGLAAEAPQAVLSAYDPRFADAAAGPALRKRAHACGVVVSETPAGATAGADVVLSLVVGSAAVRVGGAVGANLGKGQIFVDLNSISPEGKKEVARALRASGDGEFVEGAIMARVPPYKHKVPILLAGPSAAAAAEKLNALGMSCEAVGEQIGQACAVKMIRSVMVKGVEALLIESLTAAEVAGVRERIIDSIAETFPGIDWRESATYYIGRTQEHGARRVTEMNESAETLRGLGVEPMLTAAIAQRIADAYEVFQAAALPSDSGYRELLVPLAEAARGRDERTDTAA
jgi:3-hydroxyisobutyrate dehydrogenase-like beta-hydroxyacid dehydrogenase